MARDYRANIRALGVCGHCKGGTFTLEIYDCGHFIPRCANCLQAWETSWEPKGVYAGGDEAVGSGGDESPHLVSKKA